MLRPRRSIAQSFLQQQQAMRGQTTAHVVSAGESSSSSDDGSGEEQVQKEDKKNAKSRNKTDRIVQPPNQDNDGTESSAASTHRPSHEAQCSIIENNHNSPVKPQQREAKETVSERCSTPITSNTVVGVAAQKASKLPMGRPLPRAPALPTSILTAAPKTTSSTDTLGDEDQQTRKVARKNNDQQQQ